MVNDSDMTHNFPTVRKNIRISTNIRILLIFILSVCVFSFFGARYLAGTLGGNANWHILSSVVFGPPEQLKNVGLEPLYTLPEDGGWDGQQYFYAANDILDRHETSAYLDGARAIRYQRMGLGFASLITSQLSGHEWITPKDFLYTNIFIIFTGLILLLVQWGRRGLSIVPAVAIFFSPIVYLSAFNGLLDAAADSLFIIFVVSMLRGRAWIPVAMVSGALCVLTREAYLLAFAVFFTAFFLLRLLHTLKIGTSSRILSSIKQKSFSPSYWHIAAPLFAISCFFAWLLWLRLHFGYWPSSKAGAVVDSIPFRSLLNNIIATLNRTPRVVSEENIGFELGSLIVFSTILISSLVLNSIALIRVIGSSENLTLDRMVLINLSVVGILFFILYSLFGNTVMEHYTGFIKPLGLLLLTTASALYLGNFKRLTITIVSVTVAASILWVDVYLYRDRLREQFPHHFKEVVSQSGLKSDVKMECLPSNSVSLTINGLFDTNTKPLLRDALGLDKFFVLDVSISNNSDKKIAVSAKDVTNPLFLIGEVLDESFNPSTAWRSVLRQEVLQGHESDFRVLIEIPNNIRKASLRVKVVQPDCSKQPLFATNPFLLHM